MISLRKSTPLLAAAALFSMFAGSPAYGESPQSRRVEAETARQYLALSQAERKAFREARKRAWSHMSVQEKSVLRGAKHPRFANLTEAQKQPFRQIALQDLGIVNAAPVALLDGEI